MIIQKNLHSNVEHDFNEPLNISPSNNVFFDTNKFHDYHSRLKKKVISYTYFYNSSKMFAFHIGIDNDFSAYSPYSAPFSNINTFQNYNRLLLRDFLVQVLNHLKKLKVKFFELTLFPDHYDRNFNQLLYILLLEMGFVEKYRDVNSYLDLSLIEDYSSYQASLSGNVRRQINKCKSYNLFFNKVSNLDYLDCFNVIVKNKLENGYPITMAFDHIKDLIDSEILRFSIFKITSMESIISSAFVIEFDSKNAFLLYWGDLLDFRKLSPMSLLSNELIKHYLNEGFDSFDFGPSSKKGVLNKGLLFFKERQGSIKSNKYTLTINT